MTSLIPKELHPILIISMHVMNVLLCMHQFFLFIFYLVKIHRAQCNPIRDIQMHVHDMSGHNYVLKIFQTF